MTKRGIEAYEYSQPTEALSSAAATHLFRVSSELQTKHFLRLAIMRLFFCITCLAQFSYIILLPFTDNFAEALCLLGLMAANIAILYGMWRLYFWPYATVIALHLIEFMLMSVGAVEAGPKGFGISALAVVATLSAWQVRATMNTTSRPKPDDAFSKKAFGESPPASTPQEGFTQPPRM